MAEPFKCDCGELIKPPEILPAMVLGGSAEYGEFQIKLTYLCPNCKKEQKTRYRGKLGIDTIEIYSIKTNQS
jgi:hypothetical protein